MSADRRNHGPALRLSPREVDDLIQSAQKNAKLTRLNQVREQSAEFSKAIMENVDQRRRRELANIQQKLEHEAKENRNQVVLNLETEILDCFTQFGKAHLSAKHQADPRIAVEARKLRNTQAARLRGLEAVEQERNEQLRQLKAKSERIEKRQRALEVEQIRSRHVVSTAPPKPPEAKLIVKNELPKVIIYDKKSLYQTEYTPKDVLIEEIPPQSSNARLAAQHEERQRALNEQHGAAKKIQLEAKTEERGRAALQKERVHQNYLRLLNELDKLEKDKKEETNSANSRDDSTESSMENKSTFSKTREDENFDHFVDVTPIRDAESADIDEIPVRDEWSREHIPRDCLKPSSDYEARLQEIGQLLAELQREQKEYLEEDKQIEIPVKLARDEDIVSESTEQERVSCNLIESKSYKLDDAVRVNIEVFENPKLEHKKHLFPESEKQKIPEILAAIRRERKQLEQLMQSQNLQPRKLATPKQTPSEKLSSIATSTPIEKPSLSENRQILKYYIEKLLRMRREQIRHLSVSSSSKAGSPSIVGNSSSTSSLPLGADASVFAVQRLSETKEESPASTKSRTTGSGGVTLQPLVEIYNDVYEAFNERAALLRGQVSALRRQKEKLASKLGSAVEESTLKSLTLTLTDSSDQRGSGARSFESFHLSETATEATSQAPDLWNTIQDISQATSSSQQSQSGVTDASSDISMPDVDAALRRLGLPSMQTVLRR